MIIDEVEIDSSIELLAPQSHENVAIIPLKTETNYLDILSLKKGFELGLVEVKECETSTVNTLIVKNNAVTPLILIDGEEVVGGDQNRIINSTVIVPDQSEAKISVSCSERGRWAYKNEFKSSEYIAHSRARMRKMHAMRNSQPVQSAVWDSIDCLEDANDFQSPTSAMSESYENRKVDLNKILKSFKIADGQTGVLIIINGDIKGFELLLNSEIYREYHEKILKSYLIDAEVENMTFTISSDEARDVIEKAFESEFEKKESDGLESAYEFENELGLGKVYTYKDKIMHMSYFKKPDEYQLNEDIPVNDYMDHPIME